MKSVIDLSKQKRISKESLEEASTLFTHHGTVKIRGAFNQTKIRKLRQYIETHYLAQGEKSLEKRSSAVHTGRYLSPIRIENWLNQPAFYAPTKLMPILESVLRPDFVLHAFGAITAFPNAPTQNIHLDHSPLFPESTTLDAFFPPYAVHLSIPLIDLNEKTGTTAVWENSHRKPLENLEALKKWKCPPYEGASLPYMNAGDCLLTDFRLYHRGMENKTDYPRPFLYMVFCRNWFHDGMNYPKHQRMQISQSELQQVPARYQFLFNQYRSVQ